MGGSDGTDGDIKNWAAALEEEYTNNGNGPTGDGWMTFTEFHESVEGGVVKARKMLRLAVEKGDIEVFTGSQKSTATGYLCRQVWYRPKT